MKKFSKFNLSTISFGLYIAKRYLLALRGSKFSFLISLVSILGIGISIIVLITVMSVMNGFDQEIESKISGVVSHISIRSVKGSIGSWQKIASKLHLKQPKITAISPHIEGQGILINGNLTHPAMVFGVLPNYESTTSIIPKSMLAGSFNQLKAHSFNIVIGSELSKSLNANVGDYITLLIPSFDINLIGASPRFKQFKVAGIFNVGNGFGFDSDFSYISLKDAKVLYKTGNEISELTLKLHNLFEAPKIAKDLYKVLADDFVVSDWTNTYGSYMHAIKLEKTMMFIILLFLIAIATFNLVSMLVMTVMEKRADIAILRTFGANKTNILLIFIMQGLGIGLIGTILGIAGGVLLSLNITHIVELIEKLLHTQLISQDVYFLNYLPSKIFLSDIAKVSIASIVMCVCATIYPAIRATLIEPAKVLREF